MKTKEKSDPKKGDLVANCDHIGLTQSQIESCILTIRNQQVMIDSDLANLYNVDTKRLNEQVKRNIDRFPPSFRFQLTKDEMLEVVANCDHLTALRFSPTQHFVFTEQGVAMLSAVLHSPVAVAVSIRIMEAFVLMRRFLASNTQVFQRLETIEYHQLEMERHLDETDKRVDSALKLMTENSAKPQQGIFFDQQIYDAYEFVSGLIKQAKKRIVLIDNYVDESVLTMLDKREAGVTATIYTAKIDKQLQLDIAKHNTQYPAIDVKIFTKSHDRFLCIDSTVYHVGASIKDLGKKWFAFSILHDTKLEDLVKKIMKS